MFYAVYWIIFPEGKGVAQFENLENIRKRNRNLRSKSTTLTTTTTTSLTTATTLTTATILAIRATTTRVESATKDHYFPGVELSKGRVLPTSTILTIILVSKLIMQPQLSIMPTELGLYEL